MPFLKIDIEKEKKNLAVQIDEDVMSELDEYVAFYQKKNAKVKRPQVVQELLREGMKRDPDFKASKKTAPPTISKGKVA